MKKYLKLGVRRLLLLALSERASSLVWDDLRFVILKAKNLFFLNKRRIARRIQTAPRPLYLNLGSGTRGVNDARWINVDGYSGANIEFCFNIMSSWPFPDSCFDGIFTEHVLEHFTREEGLKLLKECYRVLQPNGLIRIVVPDGQKIMKAYFADPDELARHRGKGFACSIKFLQRTPGVSPGVNAKC